MSALLVIFMHLIMSDIIGSTHKNHSKSLCRKNIMNNVLFYLLGCIFSFYVIKVTTHSYSILVFKIEYQQQISIKLMVFLFYWYTLCSKQNVRMIYIVCFYLPLVRIRKFGCKISHP